MVRKRFGFQFMYMVDNTMPFSACMEYLTTCLDSYVNIGNNLSMITTKVMILRSSLGDIIN